MNSTNNDATTDNRQRLTSAQHEFVWDGRGDRGANARWCIIPGRSPDDLRFTSVHFRLLTHLGRFNQQRGWCRLSQIDLAEQFDVRRQSINKALRELVEWGYVHKRGQQETGDSFCQYRINVDVGDAELRPIEAGVSASSDTPPCPAPADTGVCPTKTLVSPLRTPNNDHIDHIDKRTPVAPSRGRARRLLTELPQEWQLTSELRDWSIKRHPSHASTLSNEVEKFRGYWHGNGKRMKDWDATWRKWWVSACERPPPKSRFQVTGGARVPLSAVAKPGMTKDQIFRDRDRADDELDRSLRAPIYQVKEEPKVYRADTPEFNARITQLIANGAHDEAERIQQRGFLKEYPSKTVGLLTASLVSRDASHLRSQNPVSRGA